MVTRCYLHQNGIKSAEKFGANGDGWKYIHGYEHKHTPGEKKQHIISPTSSFTNKGEKSFFKYYHPRASWLDGSDLVAMLLISQQQMADENKQQLYIPATEILPYPKSLNN